MHINPCPPDWSRRDSRDILEYWTRYSRRTQLQGYLLLKGDEDQSWRLTAIAGYLALFLVLLLFLGTISDPVVVKPRKIKAVQFVAAATPEIDPQVDTVMEIEPRVIEAVYPVEIMQVAYEMPVVEKPVPKPEPKPFEDPFAMFAPPPEEKPSVPVAPRTWTLKPELLIESSTTELIADYQYSELTQSNVIQSRYSGKVDLVSLASSRWQLASVSDFGFAFQPPRQLWLTSAERQAPSEIRSPVPQDRVEDTQQPNVITSKMVTLRKRYPSQTSGQHKLTYFLEVTNEGSEKISQVHVSEHCVDLDLIDTTSPKATLVDEALFWILRDLLPAETRSIEISCFAPTNLAMLKSESSIQVFETLATATNVIIPDVSVSVTVPVEVESGQDFDVMILVENNSDKTFSPSELTIGLLKGVQHEVGPQLVRQIDVPSPGKSYEFPLKLTSTDVGEGIIEASLNLEESITVPVKAITKVRAVNEKSGTNATARRVSQDVVSLSE
ncbi:MAG TPA: hypothetical protein DD473_15630 [Planctomycetaceae bacterium]|nr:hypothetical protein [Planctomycetaceae bacterium]